MAANAFEIKFQELNYFAQLQRNYVGLLSVEQAVRCGVVLLGVE